MSNVVAVIATHSVLECSNILMKSCLPVPLHIIMGRYIWSSLVVKAFQVLSKQSDKFVSLKEKETLSKAVLPPPEINEESTTVRSRSPQLDERTLLPCYHDLETLLQIVSNKSLHVFATKGQSQIGHVCKTDIYSWILKFFELRYRLSEQQRTVNTAAESDQARCGWSAVEQENLEQAFFLSSKS